MAAFFVRTPAGNSPDMEPLDLEDCLDLLAGPSLAVLLPGPI